MASRYWLDGTHTVINRRGRSMNATCIETKQVLTVPEVASFLGISTTKAWELVWSGSIPSFRPGGRLRRVRREELLRWIQQREAEGETESEMSRP